MTHAPNHLTILSSGPTGVGRSRPLHEVLDAVRAGRQGGTDGRG